MLIICFFTYFAEKDIEDDPEMIEMLKMIEEAKDDLEIAEEKVKKILRKN